MTDQTKIGGWLLLLIIFIGVLMPLIQLYTIVQLYSNRMQLSDHFGDSWNLYYVFTFLIVGMRALICLVVARQLMWEKVPSTPRVAVVGIWLAFAVLGMLSLIVFAIFNPEPAPVDAMAGRMIWPIVICVVATAYLVKSERVSNIYSRQADAPRGD